MSHASLSFAEIDGQHVELLPARTVLSMFSAGGDGGSTVVGGATCQQAQANPTGLVQAIGIGLAPAYNQCIAPPVAVN